MRILLLFILFSSLSLKADFLKDIKASGKAIVVYGENAPEKEKQVARDIYQALELDDTDDLYDHIISDEYCLKHQFFYSSFHLIVVGTVKSNRLCSINAEVQYAHFNQNKSPIRIFPQANNTGNGLFSARYGYYPNPAGIGYVRRVLNPFTLQAFNIAGKKFNSQAWSAIYITGQDTEGIVSAYTYFLDEKMLEGIIIPDKKIPAKRGRFQLSKNQMTHSLPSYINPVSFKNNDKTLDYKGWIQGTVSDYAGVKTITGVTAEQIIHLKYQGKVLSLLSYDDQVNTLFCIKFASEEDSLKALKGLDKTMKFALDIKDKAEPQLYPCSNGKYEFNIVREGKCLIIENIQPEFKKDFTAKAAEIIK